MAKKQSKKQAKKAATTASKKIAKKFPMESSKPRSSKSTKKASKKPARKSASKPKAASAAKSSSPRSSKAKAAKPLRRLSAVKLTKLQSIISSLDLNHEAAFDIDFALFNSVDKELGNDYSSLRKLSPARAGFWASWWLEGEVNNGGFHQFFLNKGPVPAAVAYEFHTKHGPANVANLLGLAIKALPGGRLPADHDAMHDVLVPDDLREDDRLTKALSKVDDKYFDLLVSLTGMRLKFALDNQAEFFA